MHIIYQSVMRNLEEAIFSTQASTEEISYGARWRELEQALLCQALGGQPPQPGSQQHLQHYLIKESNRAEVLRAEYAPAESIRPA